MSKKQSEDKKKTNHVLREQHFSPRNNETPNCENESLEVRILTLIYVELLRTRGENEFVSLENRISRILRNEFVNDIMREINTADDEIAAWFNRFLESVPELNNAYRNAGSEKEMIDRCDVKVNNGLQKKASHGRKSRKSDRHQTASFSPDERTMRQILEMFRAPVQITCRACDDMRRVIRAGRRMIREIQLLAAVRSDAQSMRRLEMKCTEELDQLRVTRSQRARSALEGWRQTLRRRVRSVRAPQPRERIWYYLVFDRLDKHKIVPQMASKSKQILLKLKKLVPFKGTPDKPRSKIWTNFTAKSEIRNIISFFRIFRLRADCDASGIHDIRQLPQLISLPSGTNILTTPNQTTAPSDDKGTENSSCPVPEDIQNARGDTSDVVAVGNVNLTDDCLTRTSLSVGNESAHPCTVDAYCIDVSCSKSDEYVSENSQPTCNPEEHLTTNEQAPAAIASPFNVSVNTGVASPQDIAVVLYSDRILEVSICRSLAQSEARSTRRRWLLPLSVNVDNLQCFLDRNILVITEFSQTTHPTFSGKPETVLGPPTRAFLPCPHFP